MQFSANRKMIGRDIWSFVNTRALQEIQLSLTNRATHLCNIQWRGWPPKLTACVLPRRIWSYYVTGYR